MKISIIRSRSFNDYDSVVQFIKSKIDISTISLVVSGELKVLTNLVNFLLKNSLCQPKYFYLIGKNMVKLQEWLETKTLLTILMLSLHSGMDNLRVLYQALTWLENSIKYVTSLNLKRSKHHGDGWRYVDSIAKNY